MSDQLRDKLLTRVSDAIRAEDVATAFDSREQDQRAQDVLGRVMATVHEEGIARRHLKRRHLTTARSARGRLVATLSVAAAVILLAGVLEANVVGGSRLHAPITTSWQPGRSLTATKAGTAQLPHHGTWMLADNALSGTWQQIPAGPPGVGVTCPTATACYEMGENTASSVENAPLLSVSFYASVDDGVTWSQFTMPIGFTPTTSLSCGGESHCATGGTFNGQSVLVSTTDGGHSFNVAPLPSSVGSLFSLSCVSTKYCGGLVSTRGPLSAIHRPNGLENGLPTDARFLSTDDDGATFASTEIAANNSLWKLQCTSSLDCAALGDRGSLNDGTNDWAAGVVEITDDGGHTWTAAALPDGFGIVSDSALSCADALHCSVSGLIDVTFENPPACATMYPHDANAPTSLPVNSGAPGAAIASIAQFESSLITSANLHATPGTADFGCTWPQETRVSDIMATTDGGNSWTPEQFPASAPAPILHGLSCPTASECWASGYDETVQQVPGGADSIESVLLGTTNGGSTWSTVTFNVPAGSPSFQSAFGDGIGSISCPTVDVCAANGVGMADATSLPFYRLAIPTSST